ncbi:putative RNA methyltransferase [Nocardia sp. NPDC051030]|uniref:putative RNA methyltransferase n=1 Tax=Nocardia sp. NPDC051030 TaxID=3155162 RepID=UPI00341A458F
MACADLLACPECAEHLTPSDRSLRCPRGHTFDIAKQGYVSLLTGASTKMTGDTPAMLEARVVFQSAGHFTPIAEALARAVAEALTRAATEAPTRAAAAVPVLPAPAKHANGITHPGSTAAAASSARLSATLLSHPVPTPTPTGPAMLEIGAGTGYYTAAVLDAVPNARGIALDVSKPAAKRSARAHPRAGAVLADAWRGLPVRDGVLSAVLSVFAPRNADEVARVLAADGRFLVVTPTARHLAELIRPLGMVSVDAAKADRLAETLGEHFTLADRTEVEYPMSLTHTDIANVAAMGPSAHHAAEQRTALIAALPNPLTVTASVTLSTYRRT